MRPGGGEQPLVCLSAFRNAAVHSAASVLFAPNTTQERSDFSDLILPLPIDRVKQHVDKAMVAWEYLGQDRRGGSSDDPRGLLSRVEEIRNSVPNHATLERDAEKKLVVLQRGTEYADGKTRSDYCAGKEEGTTGTPYTFLSSPAIRASQNTEQPRVVKAAKPHSTSIQFTLDSYINPLAELRVDDVNSEKQAAIHRFMAEAVGVDLDRVHFSLEDAAVHTKTRKTTEVKLHFVVEGTSEQFKRVNFHCFRQNLVGAIASTTAVMASTVRVGRPKLLPTPSINVDLHVSLPPPGADKLTASDLVLRIAVFSPRSTSTHMQRGKWRYPSKIAEFLFHGMQPLSALMDAIRCTRKPPGYASTSLHDDSQRPPKRKRRVSCEYQREREHSRESSLFIEHRFYSDDRVPVNSKRSMGEPSHTNKQKQTSCAQRGRNDSDYADDNSASRVRFNDLTVRLNTPYVFTHEHSCEHPFIFTDIRLFHSTSDPPEKIQYPWKVFERCRTRHVCNGCNHLYASVVCHETGLAGTLPSFLCHQCFSATHGFRHADNVYAEAYESDP